MPIIYLDNFYHPNLHIPGNVLIDGDLTVNGSNVSLNVSTIESEDQLITLNKGGNHLTSQNAGIEIFGTDINGGKASILWDDINGCWTTIGGFSGRNPLGTIIAIGGVFAGINNTSTFTAAPIPLSGEITEDGYQLMDGSLINISANPLFLGQFIPNMTDDRFLMGSSISGLLSVPDGINNGDNTVLLTVNELPSHSHGAVSSPVDLDHTHQFSYDAIRFVSSGGGIQSGIQYGGANISKNTSGSDRSLVHSHGVTVYANGGSFPFDIRPKYLAVSYLMRVR